MPLILGVDPGSVRTGWGLIDGDVGRPRLIACGEIRLGASRAFEFRLHELMKQFDELVTRYRPESAAVESPFHGASARAALQLAHARGVILAVLGGSAIPVVEYAPATVKKAVTGNGRAEKQQVLHMVRAMIGPEVPRFSTDLSDALAVALCHLTGESRRVRLAQAIAPRRARPH